MTAVLSPAAAVAGALLLGLLVAADAARLVQVVHRHGARPHLRKNAQGSEVQPLEQQPRLLPAGFDQLERLGKFVRENYLDSVSLSANNVQAYSSGLDRTLQSSAAFLKGVVADDLDHSQVPIDAAFGSPDQDRVLRAYHNCPELDKIAEKVVSSMSPASELAGDDDARNRIAAVADGQEPSLVNWFNVYDVYLQYFNERREGTNEADLQAAEQLVGELEWAKYGDPDSAGYRGGSALLDLILTRMQKANSGQDTTTALVEYSAHYPTLLSLFATLGIRNNNLLPAFGDAIVILLEDDTVEFIYLANGDPIVATTLESEQLPQGLSLKQAMDRLSDARNLGQAPLEWCASCSSETDFCLATTSSMSSLVAGLVGAVATLAIVAVLFTLGFLLSKRNSGPVAGAVHGPDIKTASPW